MFEILWDIKVYSISYIAIVFQEFQIKEKKKKAFKFIFESSHIKSNRYKRVNIFKIKTLDFFSIAN